MSILYTDHDEKVCAWLRELVEAGELPMGEVWCRDMTTVSAEEVSHFTQRHWCCGIGGWPLALKMAGWPEDMPVDTASVPCQPFSCAGQRKGQDDERHLWPVFYRLVLDLRPPVIFGEQVASSDVIGKAGGVASKTPGRVWIDGVQSNMEEAGYAFGFALLGAHSVGAPHRRQRLYWVADMQRTGLEGHAGDERDGHESGRERANAAGHAAAGCATGELADAAHTDRRSGDIGAQAGVGQDGARRRGLGGGGGASGVANAEHAERGPLKSKHERHGNVERRETASWLGACGASDGLGYTTGRRCGERRDAAQPGRGGHADRAGWAGDNYAGGVGHSASNNERRQRESGPLMRRTGAAGRPGPWSDFDILPCRDGKARHVESGVAPLVAGLPRGMVPSGDPSREEAQASAEARMMRLRGYGNAICAPLAAEFIGAWMEVSQENGGNP